MNKDEFKDLMIEYGINNPRIRAIDLKIFKYLFPFLIDLKEDEYYRVILKDLSDKFDMSISYTSRSFNRLIENKLLKSNLTNPHSPKTCVRLYPWNIKDLRNEVY